MPLDPIVPTRRDIAAWRLSAEATNRFGGVRPGEFNWPWVVLSLIGEWEKHRGRLPAPDAVPDAGRFGEGER